MKMVVNLEDNTKIQNNKKKKPPLLSSNEFNEDLLNLFQQNPLISSSAELMQVFKTLRLPEKWTVNTIKKELTNLKIINFNKSKPSGYFLDFERFKELRNNHNSTNIQKINTSDDFTLKRPNFKKKQEISTPKKIPKKISKKSSKKTSKKVKLPLVSSSAFITELKQLFLDNPIIAPASALIESFKTLNLPQKWTVNTTKNELINLGIIFYHKKKPSGYILDTDKLNELVHIYKISSSSQNHDNKIDQVSVKQGTTQNTQSQSISKPNSKEEEKFPSLAPYLLERMSSNARKILRVGLFEIKELSTSKLDKNIEHLSSARIFYDGKYANEKVLLDYIDEKVRFLCDLKEKRHEEEAEILINQLFVVKLNAGKFDSIINKYDPESNLDECVFRCIKKLGGKRSKIELSDFALQKHIADILSKKYIKNIKSKE